MKLNKETKVYHTAFLRAGDPCTTAVNKVYETLINPTEKDIAASIEEAKNSDMFKGLLTTGFTVGKSPVDIVCLPLERFIEEIHSLGYSEGSSNNDFDNQERG